jgi:hypothetical protein
MCNGPSNALVCNKTLIQMSHIKTLKITLTYFDHQGAFWSWLKSLVKILVFKCGYAAAYVHSFCMLYCAERHVDMWFKPGSKSSLMMISWWSKYVRVILSVLMCDIWINVLLQTSALVGPLHIVNWNAQWNSEIHYIAFRLNCKVATLPVTLAFYIN